MTGPRIKAADDIDAIYEAIQQLRREKAEALNRTDAEEAKPGAVTTTHDIFGLCWHPSIAAGWMTH